MSGKGISLLERWNRRTFLQGALASAGGLVFGCGGSGGGGDGPESTPPPPTPQCPNAFAGGMQVGELAFANEDPVAFGTPIGEGLDGRLFFDLSQLTPDALITPNELFYVRTRRPDLLDPAAPWQIDVSGLVDAPRALSLSDIEPLVMPMGVQLLECAGNTRARKFGLLSACEWSGAPMADVLARVGVRAEATRVLVSGFDEYSQPSADGSTPGASWIFTFAELEAAGAFLATVMNGQPLPPDHGAPGPSPGRGVSSGGCVCHRRARRGWIGVVVTPSALTVTSWAYSDAQRRRTQRMTVRIRVRAPWNTSTPR